MVDRISRFDAYAQHIRMADLKDFVWQNFPEARVPAGLKSQELRDFVDGLVRSEHFILNLIKALFQTNLPIIPSSF